MNTKAIFIDCDGTLFDVPRGMLKPSEYSKYAIKELIKNGHKVFIASGRCLCLIPDYLKELNPTGFITCNGSYAVCGSGEIYKRNIDSSLVLKVYEYCNKHNGVIYLEQQDFIYTPDLDNPLHKKFIEAWGVGDKCFKKLENLNIETQLIMTAFENEFECKQFEEAFSLIVDVRRQYGFTSFDVSMFNTNKGLGVTKILDYFSIDKNDAYAFGDGVNDIEMLENVENSYALDNAVKELKAVSKHITKDVLEDGFYEALCKEGLIKSL